MVAQMQGPSAAKKYVSDYLAADIPTRVMNYRNALLLDDSILPNPVKYLTYEPLTMDNWPTIITLVESTRQIEREALPGTLDPVYNVIYSMRTYVWVRAVGPEQVTVARDHMTMVVREAMLDRPSLSAADPAGEACDIKVDEGTITEDFSDLTLLKGERFLAASFLSYDLSLEETISRAALGTVLSTVLNESLIEKVPNAPTFLQVAAGNEVVTATWRAPTWDGGGINYITGYIIQASGDAGVNWTTYVADTESSTPYYVIPNLNNGSSYQFRVAALNLDGTGAYSSASQNVIPSA